MKKSQQRTRKKSCRCGHGTAIHRVSPLNAASASKRVHPCNFPGCKCADYKAIKLREALTTPQ